MPRTAVTPGRRTASPYRRTLATPGAAGFFAAAALARVGIAMTGLALVWLIHAATGAYRTAGLVTGAFALAEAVVGPRVARLIDRHGQPRVLPVVLLVHAGGIALLLGLAAAHAPTAPLVLAGALAGAAIPQAGALSAARWSHLLGGDPLLATAFALESLVNAVAFLIGPTLAATVAAFVSPRAGSVLACTLVVGGGLTLAAMTSTAPPPAARGGPRAVRGHRLLRPAFLVIIGLNVTLGVVFGSMQLSITAFAIDHDVARLAGPLSSVGGCAGVLAGFVWGHRRWTTRPAVLLRRVWWVFAAGSVPLVFAAGPWSLGGALILPGLAVPPTLILCAGLTQQLVSRDVLTEAFTWTNSASAAGLAAAGAVSGALADSVGTRWSFALVVLAVSAGAVLLTATRRTFDGARPAAADAAAGAPAQG